MGMKYLLHLNSLRRRPAVLAALTGLAFLAGWAPAASPAADNQPIYSVCYVWTESLPAALDYMNELGRLLGEDIRRELHVVRREKEETFGIVLELERGREVTVKTVALHNEALVAAGYDRAEICDRGGYFDLFNISYGVGPNLDAQKRNFRTVQRVLGPEVAKDLVIEETLTGQYALVYKRLGDRDSGRRLVRRHKELLRPYGLDAALRREQNNETVFGEASELHEDLSGPPSEIEVAPDTTGVDSVEVAAEEIRPPQPPTPAPGLDSELEAVIERHVKDLRSRGVLGPEERTSWSVYDFTLDQKLVSINEDYEFQAASMIKPFVALAFFHKAARKQLVYGPQSRRHLARMIQLSSNSSTNWVMRQVGGPAAVQAILQRHYGGIFRNTHIVEYIPAGGRTYRNKASAHDYSRFLYALWQDRLPYSSEVKRLMALPGSDRVYHGVPNIPVGTLVYNKTGTTAQVVGDMGILVPRGQDGRRYPYTFIGIIERSERSPAFSRFVHRRGDVIRSVSGLVFEHMKANHGLR
jgi:beta-lactamase class A